MPGLTQCAAVAHLSWGAHREPADSPALGAFPRTWEMEGRKAMLRSGDSSAARRDDGLLGPPGCGRKADPHVLGAGAVHVDLPKIFSRTPAVIHTKSTEMRAKPICP